MDKMNVLSFACWGVLRNGGDLLFSHVNCFIRCWVQ